MKCFNHKEKEAIGVCKYCHKGLCQDCAKDLIGGLACVDRCEDTVLLMIKDQNHYYKRKKNLIKNQLVWAAIVFFYGVFTFVHFGLTRAKWINPFSVMGLMLIGGALFSLFSKIEEYKSINKK
jgi:hypothetical protein